VVVIFQIIAVVAEKLALGADTSLGPGLWLLLLHVQTVARAALVRR